MFRRLLNVFGFNKPKETIIPQSVLVPEPAALAAPTPKLFTPIDEIMTIRRVTTAPAYKSACAQSIAFYETKYKITLNKADCMTMCSDVWFALDLWKNVGFVRCAVDINDTRAELVFQLAITNDHVEDLKATLKVLLEKHGFQFRMDIATVGSRSYALVHVWKE